MKTYIPTFAALVPLLGLFSLPAMGQVPELTVTNVTADYEYIRGTAADPMLRIGATRDEVLSKIGSPTKKITSQDWAYMNVFVEKPNDGMRKFNTLVVTFKNDRVVGMFLTRQKQVDVLVAAAHNRPVLFDAKRTILAGE